MAPIRAHGWRSKIPMNLKESFPLNPEHHLTPGPLPHFVAERETEIAVVITVQGFNTRNWLRGILTPTLLGEEREKRSSVRPDPHFKPHPFAAILKT
jgi:hypothetical protein